MNSKRVIIDTDPGVDDAAAILLALSSPELSVEALTTVFGNVDVEQTTRNALKILEVAGRTDIPVFQGATKPLMREPRYAASIHGTDGLGEVGLASTSQQPTPGRAAEEIVRRVMEAPGEITLIALGPPTNVAIAALLEPRIASNVKELIYMGGAVFHMGNVSPVASANNLNDPEATAIMYQAGFPLVQVGLDVCQHCYVTDDQLQELRAAGGPKAEFLLAISRHHKRAYQEGWKAAVGYTEYGQGPWAHFNDLPCTAFAVAPELFETVESFVGIETRGLYTDGQTVMDMRGQLGRLPNARVCLKVDGRAVARLLVDRLHR